MKPKNTLLFLLLGLLSYQCTNIKNKSESIVRITGNIENPSLENLYLLNRFGDTLSIIGVDINNNFDQELHNIEERYYSLLYGEGQSILYLSLGDSLHFNMGADSLLISGKGAERNNYLERKKSPEFDWYTNINKCSIICPSSRVS